MAKQVKSAGISAQQIIDAFDGVEAAKVSSQALINEAIKTDAGKRAIGEAATHFVSEGTSQDPRLMVLRQQVQRADSTLTIAKDKESEDGRYIVKTKAERAPSVRIKSLPNIEDLEANDLLKLFERVRAAMRAKGIAEPKGHGAQSPLKAAA